jgi:hypothetical protein
MNRQIAEWDLERAKAERQTIVAALRFHNEAELSLHGELKSADDRIAKARLALGES